jgi:hypothetical protein
MYSNCKLQGLTPFFHMVGGGAAVTVSKLPEVIKPIAESADSFLSPLGTGLAIAFVLVVVVMLFARLRRIGP